MRQSIHTLALAVVLSTNIASMAEPRQLAGESTRKKAVDLLTRFADDVKALSLPENRIWLLTRTVDLAWRADEPLARTLVVEAVKAFEQIAEGLDDSDLGYQQVLDIAFQLRQEMVVSIARHDTRLALEFLQATRQPALIQRDHYYRRPDFESELETRLALETASKSPAEALRLAAQALSRGFSSHLPNLLSQLRQIDGNGAARLAREAVARLQPGDIRRDSAANSIAFYLIADAMRINQGDENRPPLLDEKTLVELKNAVFGDGVEVLSSAPAYATVSLMSQLTPIMPEFEKYVQVRVPALRPKLADLLVMRESQAQLWQKYLEMEQRSVDELLAALPQAPVEVQQRFYQQAAWNAFNQGDTVRARAIVEEKMTDPAARKQMLAGFNEQLFWRAAEQGKVEEARHLASQVHSVERKVSVLAQLSSRVLQSGNKRLALDLLDEASAATTGLPSGYSGLMMQLELAKAYAGVEAGRGFEIAEAGITILNDAIAAARQLDGFDVHYFSRGELVVFRGGQLVDAVNRLSDALGALGKTDFDRGAATADLLQLNEARLVARLSVLEKAVSDAERVSQ